MDFGSSDLPYWKEIWLICSGVQQSISREDVQDYLNECKKYFLIGLHQFQSHQKDESSEAHTKLDLNEKLTEFLKRLRLFLDLKSDLTKAVLTQYLLYAFHGTPTTLQNLTSSYLSSTKLLQDVWHFYTSERMYYLKTLKLILEYHTDKTHPYYNEFSAFIEDAHIKIIRESLLTQFKLLISVNITLNDDMNMNMQSLWIDRNLREQLEILQCIILTHESCPITIKETITFIELFSCHRFGWQPIYQNLLLASHKNFQYRITICEAALLLCIFDNTLSERDNIAEVQLKQLHSWIIRFNNEFGEEFSPIVLSWILYRFDQKKSCNETMVETTLRNIKNIITNAVFKDQSKCSKIVRKSIYNVLHSIISREFININETLLYECLSIVLRDVENAEKYWIYFTNTDNSIVNEKWNFPANFVNYSLVAQGLASANLSCLKNVLMESFKLPVTCIFLNEEVRKYLNLQNNVIYFSENYCPFSTNTIVIKKKSVAVIGLSNQLHVQNEINYWLVLLYLIEVTEERIRGGNYPSFDDLCVGFQFWLTILNNIKAKDLLTNVYIIQPVLSILDLFNEMLTKRMTNTEVFAYGLEIISLAQKLQPNPQVYDKLKGLNLFPVVINKNATFEEFIKPTNFIQGRIFDLILNFDFIHNKYQLLRAYLKFLKVRFELKCLDLESFEIPGVIFILQEVLPKFSEWKIEIGSVEQEIIYDTIDMIFNVLQISSDSIRCELFQMLQKICIFDLLHIPNGIVILNIVARGNKHLELIMHGETNWISGPGVQYLHIVQMSLSILMLLFQKKHLVAEKTMDMPLEVVMFTQPKEEDTLKIIQNIASYMENSVNQQLPVLACRILRKFALKLQISLHGCFDMDSDQIRHLFVHRLRSKEESESLKIAILDFIIACVQCQPGLTQAFFSKPTENDIEDETLLGVMEEFLDKLSEETKCLNSQILSSVMSLFHELWKNQKQAVVLTIRKNESFWKKLCNPLLCFVPELKAYSQLFNIITLEIYSNKKSLDSNLKDILNKCLDTKQPYFQKWIDYVFIENLEISQLENVDFDSDSPDWLLFLQSWKNFICILIYRFPEMINDDSKVILGHHCLNALVQQIDSLNDSRIVTILSELYIVFLVKWKCKVFRDTNETIELLTKLIALAKNSYKVWNAKSKIAILGIAVASMRLLKKDIRKEESVAMTIFNYSCKLASDELYLLESKHKSENTFIKEEIRESLNKILDFDIRRNSNIKIKESILKMNFLNEMLVICCNFDELYRSCTHTKLCSRLIQSLKYTVQVREEYPITITLLDCLINLAKTSYGEEFLHCDLSLQLWIKCLPPKQILKKDHDPFDETAWKIEEWWSLYQRILLVIGVLTKQLRSRFVEEALSFVMIHEQYLIECILLARQTVDMKALNLVEATVTFIYEIMKYQNQWKAYHIDSFYNIQKALQLSLYYCISLLLRPFVIIYYVEKKEIDMEDALPSKEVLEVINKFTDILIRISQILCQLTPSLLTLLCSHCYMGSCSVLLEQQFNMPKLSSDDDYELSFGTLLSAINLYARSLLHIHLAENKQTSKDANSMEKSSSSPRKRSGSPIFSIENKPKSDSSSERIPIDLYPSPTVSITSNAWLKYLNKNKSLRALETLLTLLASQTIVYLMDREETRKQRQYMCREVNSELATFHEYVKKITPCGLTKSVEDYSRISRVKLGATPLKCSESKIKPRNLLDNYSHVQGRQANFRGNNLFANTASTDTIAEEETEINILSEVNFDHPDYIIFLSNLFTSICKKEDL